MDNDLYFIPIIADALGQKDAGQAIKKAFEKIESLGTAPQYKQGYEQFRQFMDIVKTSAAKSNSNDIEPDFITELITSLASDSFEGSQEDRQKALKIIESHPKWRQEYNQLLEELKQLNYAPEGTRINITCDNEPVGSVGFTDIPGAGTIDNIRPGKYSISFDSGRVIWEGDLAGKDLIWAMAHPKEPFKLAADTAGQKAKPTKQVSLFNDEITIRVFAGLESGRMEIEMNRTKGSK